MPSAVSLSRPPTTPESAIAGRRLTDRILEAFNHAYGLGAKEVAKALLNALECAETGGRDCRIERRVGNSLMQADLWVAFVDARDAYNRIAADEAPDSESVSRALSRMKTAYMHWSDAVPTAAL